MTALMVLREIAAAFENDQAPVSTEDLYSRLDLPGEFGQKLVAELINRGLLAKTSEPRPGLTLNRYPEHIRLSDIAEAMADVSLAQPHPDTHKSLYDLAQAERTLLAQRSLREVLDLPTTPGEQAPPEEESSR